MLFWVQNFHEEISIGIPRFQIQNVKGMMKYEKLKETSIEEIEKLLSSLPRTKSGLTHDHKLLNAIFDNPS